MFVQVSSPLSTQLLESTTDPLNRYLTVDILSNQNWGAGEKHSEIQRSLTHLSREQFWAVHIFLSLSSFASVGYALNSIVRRFAKSSLHVFTRWIWLSEFGEGHFFHIHKLTIKMQKLLEIAEMPSNSLTNANTFGLYENQA